MTAAEVYDKRKAFLNRFFPYVFVHYSLYNYGILRNIMTVRRAGAGSNSSYNRAIIMLDTETSKKDPSIRGENHIVAWTISIRAFDRNICTLWGHKPSTLVETLKKIHNSMDGDNTIFYCHNFAYDYLFLRKFLYRELGHPVKQLNTKPHYPVNLVWSNGIQIRDSLILAQRSLDKWAKDLQVDHQKAVGKWDYDKVRSQKEVFTQDELEYIEHDTLAGVECIDKTMKALGKHIYAIPFTATGIPREETRKRGKENRAHDQAEKIIPETYAEQLILELIYHGGFTHANRHYINVTFRAKKGTDGQWIVDTLIICYDFASSYPYQLLTNKFPCEKFTPYKDCSPDFILSKSEDYAFTFKLIMLDVRLKDDFIPMPVLQYSKCVKTVNPILDNGRILAAKYIEIWVNEEDLSIIWEQYKALGGAICTNVQFAVKDYLPRWFTDYVYELFEAKCKLKGGDPVLYALAKAKLNSLYGLCVQRPVRCNLVEDFITGEYIEEDADMEALFTKYRKKKTTILPYSNGIWVTSGAMKNLFKLGSCIKPAEEGGCWIYSDTDSVYATGWDESKLDAFNKEIKQKLLDRGYGPVVVNNKEYWLGVAEKDNIYTEYKVEGAKRYCGRALSDGELHITVAGVPKKGAECLKDDIENFAPGLIFDGKTTGKKTHTYFYVDDIYLDKEGNETADSIDLSKCDYLLSSVDTVDWERIFTEEIQIQVYGEEDII